MFLHLSFHQMTKDRFDNVQASGDVCKFWYSTKPIIIGTDSQYPYLHSTKTTRWILAQKPLDNQTNKNTKIIYEFLLLNQEEAVQLRFTYMTRWWLLSASWYTL